MILWMVYGQGTEEGYAEMMDRNSMVLVGKVQKEDGVQNDQTEQDA
jgi:hypothetical protein